MKQLKKTIIFYGVHNNDTNDIDWPPENAHESLKWFSTKLLGAKAPLYMQAAKIILGADIDSEMNAYPTIEIFFESLETDEEERSRIEREESFCRHLSILQKRKEMLESEKEKAKFLRLKAKYGE